MFRELTQLALCVLIECINTHLHHFQKFASFLIYFRNIWLQKKFVLIKCQRSGKKSITIGVCTGHYWVSANLIMKKKHIRLVNITNISCPAVNHS